MLAKLIMELDIPDELNFSINKSSLLHGVIMEQIDSEYAEKLHENRMNPFSMYLTRTKSGFEWTVCAYSEEAYSNIIEKLMYSHFDGFELKHNGRVRIGIKSKKLETKKKSELMDEFYDKYAERYFNIRFKTPTSFKMNGRYIFYPDMELMYRNIMNKYNNSSDGVSVYDEDTLEQILKNSRITKYNLRSVLFHMEGIKIPAFTGDITIRVNGTDTMRNFVRLLFKHSEYSGIGIKCSLGMGAVELRKDDGR